MLSNSAGRIIVQLNYAKTPDNPDNPPNPVDPSSLATPDTPGGNLTDNGGGAQHLDPSSVANTGVSTALAVSAHRRRVSFHASWRPRK
ncbi:MAG: hypothetical protein LBP35_04095 [Candidatus Ancillula trichonymphae]|nr:hypothetical protein [Candidatus Ancillula trichonymphae]